MKEIITEVTEPVYVTVKKGSKTKQVKQYQSDDGTIFDKKSDAEGHDDKLKFDKIDHIAVADSIISELGHDWYRAKTEEELELLKKRLVWSYAIVYGLENIKIGEWFNYHTEEDGGDYRDTITFTTLSQFKKEVSELMDLLKE